MDYIKSKLFVWQLFIQLAFSLAFLLVDFSELNQAILCGMLLCIVGIPHGANDHLYHNDSSVYGMFRFLSKYIGIILLYLILWLIVPPLAFIVFFLFSFHHFGQSNFETPSVKYLPSILWGVWILAFPVLLHFDEAIDIFKQMLSITNEKATLPVFSRGQLTFSSYQFWIASFLAVSYISALWAFERRNFQKYIIQFFLVSIWYISTPLLTGFIVVFCLWHSTQSIYFQADYFNQVLGKPIRYFIRAMLPFALLSLISLVIYGYFRGLIVHEVFILLSLISLPHILVMHRLHNQVNHRAASV